MRHVIVLGGTGGLGKLVCAELQRRGISARGTGRCDGDARDPEVVSRLADGAEAIVNCAGTSVGLGLGHGWRGYRAVDTPIGLAAVEKARLVYVGVHHRPEIAACTYVGAHERVFAAMREVDGVIVRATGFSSAFGALLPLARRGMLVDIGDGRARTNPIDEADLAAIVADAVIGDGPRERCRAARAPSADRSVRAVRDAARAPRPDRAEPRDQAHRGLPRPRGGAADRRGVVARAIVAHRHVAVCNTRVTRRPQVAASRGAR